MRRRPRTLGSTHLLKTPIVKSLLFNQGAESAQVDHVEVFAVFLALGGFEIHWEVAESPVAQEQAEGLEAEVTAADVGVAIDAAAEGFFRVVEVQGAELLEADGAVELAEGVAVVAGGVEAVSGGEDVAGVDADAEAVGIADGVENLGEVLEAVTERGALAGGGFEEGLDSEAGGLAVDLVEGGGDAAETDVLAGADVCSGVGDEVGEAEGLGAAELEDEAVDGAAVEGAVGAGEVDEVGVVAGGGCETGGADGLGEAADVFVGEVFGVPAVGALGEELDGLAAGASAGLGGFVMPACDRHVCAE